VIVVPGTGTGSLSHISYFLFSKIVRPPVAWAQADGAVNVVVMANGDVIDADPPEAVVLVVVTITIAELQTWKGNSRLCGLENRNNHLGRVNRQTDLLLRAEEELGTGFSLIDGARWLIMSLTHRHKAYANYNPAWFPDI
jgi:hypothetical protein